MNKLKLNNKDLVLRYYPQAVCKLRPTGKEYYEIHIENKIIGQGKTTQEAWRAAYKWVYSD